MCVICDSIVVKYDSPEYEYGLSSVRKLGNLGDRRALVGLEPLLAPPLAEVAPSRPMTSNAGKFVSQRLKPVASTSVSISCRVPSSVTMPSGSIRSIGVVSRWTCGG